MALFINGVGQDSFSMNGVSVDNLYVDSVLVWSKTTGEPPIYELTEPLVTPGDGFSYLLNSASSGSRFNGKLLTSTDTAWTPTAQEYPEDGTIDFGTNKADTQWTPPSNEEYTFTFIDNVDMDDSYDMVSINAKGDGLTADVYYNRLLATRDTGLDYAPPTESVELTENMYYTIVPKHPLCVITMSQYTFSSGDTATVTFTWDTVVSGFQTNQITVPKGTLSPIVQDTDSPWIWTATFTPDEDVSESTNVISIGSVYDIDDNWGNTTINTTTGPNYQVLTSDSLMEIYINFDDSGTVISEFDVNTITEIDYSDIPSTFVDSLGNAVTGMSMTYTGNDTDSVEFADGNPTFGSCMGSEGLAVNGTYNNYSSVTFKPIIPSGNYEISTLHTRNSPDVNKSTDVTIGGTTKTMSSSNDNIGSHCLLFTGIVSDGVTPIDILISYTPGGDDSAYCNAIKIEKV